MMVQWIIHHTICIALVHLLLFRPHSSFLSVLTQGAHLPRPGRPVFSGYDLKTVRWMGILQRIAISYFIVGALEIVANALDATLAKQTRSKDNRHHDDNAAKTQVRSGNQGNEWMNGLIKSYALSIFIYPLAPVAGLFIFVSSL